MNTHIGDIPFSSSDSIRIERHGAIGFLILSQASTLNALSLDMVNALHTGLQSLESHDEVKLIVIKSAIEKAFCAGGDMKCIRAHAMASEFDAIDHYFKSEYRLNLAIAQCSKPYLALIDGIAMGGGLGLSVNGRFRVVSEFAVMAMPESRIGFFPDVGATWFLPRLPQRCGYWMALTAFSVKGRQCVQTGLATHLIQRNQLEGLIQSLQEALQANSVTSATAETVVATCLDLFSKATTEAASATDEHDALDFEHTLTRREQWFSDADLARIRYRLAADAPTTPDAEHLLQALESGSPYSLETTLELFKRSMGLSLAQCLALERAAAQFVCKHPDLIEGVRAVLVDKDKRPHWLGRESAER